MAPGDLLQGQAQRLGVGEAAVGEQRERRAQRRQLVVGELDRVEVEVLGRQRVELGLEEALAGLLDPELDAEALELRAVGVEAAREGVVVHVAVALDLALDLEGRNRPALGHQERDQRELADQLLGVLRHGWQDSLRPHAMDFLRNLFGSLTSGIIRLAVTVGILAAVYFFIVKPVLHTTENVSNTVNNSIESANKSFEQSFGPHSVTSKALHKANRQVQIQITRTFHRSSTPAGGNPMKLLHCVQAAHGNVNRIQRCTVRFAPSAATEPTGGCPARTQAARWPK